MKGLAMKPDLSGFAFGTCPADVKPDGRMMNGNTRTKVLEERGYDINRLPREIHEDRILHD
jgi:hypothetical protein